MNQRIINIKNFKYLALIIVSLAVILLSSNTVKAIEPNSTLIARNNIWSSASFPVERFQRYTSPFGYRRSPRSGRLEFHNGLDIAAPQGSYIRNWWGGKVIKVGDRGACGTHIIVQSGNWKHSYCHMKGGVQKINGRLYMVDRAGGIKIAKGQQVPAGARIGRIGMTGRTTGPHLHWVLRYGSNYVDPAQVLRAMYSKQAIRPQSNMGSNQRYQIKLEESKVIGNQ
ncbi:metalloendopeptidase-like membrane protein [Rivularia sp. PCC 7116]|uniref:M23 family metallopeptidase n=1 Tax=Rivularia sp. PCC 7116 TaxID=373994 RepID=UPI00029EECDE|nr:M23 family metallopeptidase [Rivularia sp. PCC 7116]AFY55658.1 metalloendopeptidase-like membrane protein [Rivularia sp. PCC 7116]